MNRLWPKLLVSRFSSTFERLDAKTRSCSVNWRCQVLEFLPHFVVNANDWPRPVNVAFSFDISFKLGSSGSSSVIFRLLSQEIVTVEVRATCPRYCCPRYCLCSTSSALWDVIGDEYPERYQHARKVALAK